MRSLTCGATRGGKRKLVGRIKPLREWRSKSGLITFDGELNIVCIIDNDMFQLLAVSNKAIVKFHYNLSKSFSIMYVSFKANIFD